MEGKGHFLWPFFHRKVLFILCTFLIPRTLLNRVWLMTWKMAGFFEHSRVSWLGIEFWLNWGLPTAYPIWNCCCQSSLLRNQPNLKCLIDFHLYKKSRNVLPLELFFLRFWKQVNLVFSAFTRSFECFNFQPLNLLPFCDHRCFIIKEKDICNGNYVCNVRLFRFTVELSTEAELIVSKLFQNIAHIFFWKHTFACLEI